MTDLKKDASLRPIYHATVVVLIFLGILTLPVGSLLAKVMSDKTAHLVGGITTDLTVIVLAVILTLKYGLTDNFIKISVKGLLLCLPALLVAVNNFPLISLFLGKIEFVAQSYQTALFIIYCLFTALSEGLVFVGLIFPLLTKALKKYKHSSIWALISASLIFALSHLINLANGVNVGAVFMQVGYTFLTSALFIAIFILTKNIFPSVCVHFIFDFGGLMLDENIGLANGRYFYTLSIIITVVLGVIMGVYFLIITLKNIKKGNRPFFFD